MVRLGERWERGKRDNQKGNRNMPSSLTFSYPRPSFVIAGVYDPSDFIWINYSGPLALGMGFVPELFEECLDLLQVRLGQDRRYLLMQSAGMVAVVRHWFAAFPASHKPSEAVQARRNR